MQSLKAPQIQSQTQQYNKMGTKTTAKRQKINIFSNIFAYLMYFTTSKDFQTKLIVGGVI